MIASVPKLAVTRWSKWLLALVLAGVINVVVLLLIAGLTTWQDPSSELASRTAQIRFVRVMPKTETTPPAQKPESRPKREVKSRPERMKQKPPVSPPKRTPAPQSSVAQAKPITNPPPKSEAKSKPERRSEPSAKPSSRPTAAKGDHQSTPVHERAEPRQRSKPGGPGSASGELTRKPVPPRHRISPADKQFPPGQAARRNPFEPKHSMRSTNPGDVHVKNVRPTTVTPPRVDMPAQGSGARLPSVRGNNPKLTGPPGRWFPGPETRGGGSPGGRLASAPRGSANFGGAGKGSGNPGGASVRSSGGGGRSGIGAGGGGSGRGGATSGGGGASGGAQVLSRVMPNYPGIARSRKLQGWVMVEVTVSRNGTVSNPRVVGASPSGVFESAALEAIMKWRFKPAMRQGMPIEQRVRQRVNFVLR